MWLTDRLQREGNVLTWLRSYLPLTIPAAVLAAVIDAVDFEGQWGDSLHDDWVYICMVISFVGLSLRWATVGFVPADAGSSDTRLPEEKLRTTGLYSLVRYPLIVANFIVIIGIALSTTAWWFVLLVALIYCLCIERTIAIEAQVLGKKFGPEYEAWVKNTPMFLPRFTRWRPPTERFSLRTVLRRECHGPLFVGASYVVLEFCSDVMVEGESFSEWLMDDIVWVGLFVATFITYFVLRTLKVHTRLLNAPGR